MKHLIYKTKFFIKHIILPYILSLSMIFISISGIIATGCSVIKKHNPVIDKELKPYVEMFIRDSGGSVTWKNFIGYSFVFEEDISGRTIGYCDYNSKKVAIDKIYWDHSSEIMKMALFYHEAAHCVLGKPHSVLNKMEDGVTSVVLFENMMMKLGVWKQVPDLEDGCRGTLMSPVMDKHLCINKHWDYYVYELFNSEISVSPDHLPRNEKFIDIHRQIGCSRPEIINETDVWNDEDEKNLNDAQHRCIQKYGTCVSKFYKRAEREYGVLCK